MYSSSDASQGLDTSACWPVMPWKKVPAVTAVDPPAPMLLVLPVARDAGRPHGIMRAAAGHVSGVGSALLESNILGGAGIRDGFHVAQSLVGIGDNRLGILRARAAGGDGEAKYGPKDSVGHSVLLRDGAGEGAPALSSIL